ncbi:MAG: hypothetical protein ACD_67C00094G0001, partial [uncultured bacterium]
MGEDLMPNNANMYKYSVRVY